MRVQCAAWLASRAPARSLTGAGGRRGWWGWERGLLAAPVSMLVRVVSKGGGKGKREYRRVQLVGRNDRDRMRGRSSDRDRKRGRSQDRGREDKDKRARPDRVLPKHCTHWRGRIICTGFNDGRCPARSERDCPNQRAHVCDIRLPNGKACGGAHPRSRHRA